MKKIVALVVAVLVAVVALGSAGVAFAQSPTQAFGTGNGYMGGQGAGTGDGILHDYFIAAYAEELGFTVEEMQARLDGGETLSQVALSTGLTLDEFKALAQEVLTQVLAQAVADGVITQAQADWMSQRMYGGMAGRMASGAGMMRGAAQGQARGAGQGQLANPSCIYYNQANP